LKSWLNENHELLFVSRLSVLNQVNKFIERLKNLIKHRYSRET